jgi:transglutaminase-like putative cysteine protease
MLSRRRIVAAAASSVVASALPRSSLAAFGSDAAWRRFSVTTRLELSDLTGPGQAWLPLAGFEQPDWLRVEGNSWSGSANMETHSVGVSGAEMLYVRWGDGPRYIEVTSTVVTRDRATAFDGPRVSVNLSSDERTLYLRGTVAAPTNGAIKELADRIVLGRSSDLEKANALYQWVVENTFRSAPVHGCGEGEVLAMVKSGVFGGKCADLNPLFVAMARASGLPARDLYGIRVAPSRLGYKSLGPATPIVTKAQHCRAEVFLDGFGWTAMDPADVRKVMLEEAPQGLPLTDANVVAARYRLFGGWEGNWLPFNAASDIVLPGRSDAPPVHFLMYPQVETATGMGDCYDPDRVRYTITSRELAI